MKHSIKLTAIILALLCSHLLGWSILKKGNKFHPFSLVSIKDEIFTVNLTDGKLTVTIESLDGEKKRVIHPDAICLDFWATWCVPCRAAMPYMQKLHDNYYPEPGKDEGGLVVIGIALDTAGSKIVKPFYKRVDYTYPMLADPTRGENQIKWIRSTKQMKSNYKVQVLPVVYMIDSKGIIQHGHSGFKKPDYEKIENIYLNMAKEKSDET